VIPQIFERRTSPVPGKSVTAKRTRLVERRGNNSKGKEKYKNSWKEEVKYNEDMLRVE
jgi:hypothetical protein